MRESLVFLVMGILAMLPLATPRSAMAFEAMFAPSPQEGVAESRIILRENFEDGQADGWQVQGGWQIQLEGENHILTGTGHALAWATQKGYWTNYVLRMAVQLSNDRLVISYRATQERRYLVTLRETDLTLSKDDPIGNVVPLARADVPPVTGTWHWMAIGGYEGHLQVWLDGVLQVDYTDADPILQGTVGVGLPPGAQGSVDTIIVTQRNRPLPVTPLPEAPSGGEVPPLPEGVPEQPPQPPPAELPPAAPSLPVIHYFYSEPTERAGCFYLHWDVEGAQATFLNGAGVVVPGSTEVCPDQTTSYTLLAVNEIGEAEQTVTIEVGGAPPPPPGPVQINFWADAQSVGAGGCTILHWDVEGVQTVYLNGEGVVGHDMREVCPTQTTTYILTIVHLDGTTEDREVTIEVMGGGPPGEDIEPPELTLKRSPASPTINDRITFTATASDPSGIDRIEIVVNQQTVQACPASPCVYEGGPYPAGQIEYGAYAYDTYGNRAATGWRTLNVQEEGGVVEDIEPPQLELKRSPANPTTNDLITFTATASDPSGIEHIEIIVEYELAQTCPASPCVYESGPYPVGPLHYGASAYDIHGNRAWTGYRTLEVEQGEWELFPGE